uniref:Uncharacterized protein n=1 Tax=Nelumbo nucifera TaxID=4432 RepID=A0A822Z547_NELNU|nr:TPA_asm: hypothetical protein HUJ06_014280 [Nelumbo nucifera]
MVDIINLTWTVRCIADCICKKFPLLTSRVHHELRKVIISGRKKHPPCVEQLN